MQTHVGCKHDPSANVFSKNCTLVFCFNGVRLQTHYTEDGVEIVHGSSSKQITGKEGGGKHPDRNLLPRTTWSHVSGFCFTLRQYHHLKIAIMPSKNSNNAI